MTYFKGTLLGIVIVSTAILLISIGYQYRKLPTETGLEDRQAPETQETVSEARVPREYIDQGKVVWRVVGKYETAQKDGYIFVRDSVTHQEISKLAEKIYTNFAKTIPLSINLEEKERKDGSVMYVVVNDVRSKLYVFVEIPEYQGATANTSWNIIESELDGKNMAPLPEAATGRILLEESVYFSPNNQFFSYLSHSRSGQAGCSFSRFIEVYDLVGNKAYVIEPPERPEKYIQQHNIQGPEMDIINSFINFYNWVDAETIEFSFYFSRCLDRISSQETWQYNLNTQSYRLIKAE